MKLFIPPLGTKLRLLKPWQFDLLHEDRNKSLWDLFAAVPMKRWDHWNNRRGLLCTVTLTPGDELIVDRIFIRKGSTEYNSVTFRGVISHGATFDNTTYHKVRFWVKLADTLNLDVEVIIP